MVVQVQGPVSDTIQNTPTVQFHVILDMTVYTLPLNQTFQLSVSNSVDIDPTHLFYAWLGFAQCMEQRQCLEPDQLSFVKKVLEWHDILSSKSMVARDLN